MQLQSKNNLRRRGVALTHQGSRKLNQAKAEIEIAQNFKRYTLEALSEKTGLTPNTLSKVFTSSVGVDRRTLDCCFNAFNLTLLKDDYLYLEPQQDNLQSCSSTVPGGQMSLDSVFYIDRPILESLCYEAIQQPGALINIRAPKQMGKTSLMTRILAYSETLGDRTVCVNLQLADCEVLQNLDRFLQWFCARVSKQLDLPNTIIDFWNNSLGSKSNATDYFENVILVNRDRAASSRKNRSLVIAIDELNQLFAYPDTALEFLQLLRTWSEQAKKGDADTNPWHKLRLVTVHSTEILMPPLIDPSLLNTGLVIELPEFTSAQVQDLADRCEQEINTPQTQRLITLLGGHPYRLQLAFYYLQQQTITLEELLKNSAIAFGIYADHLEQQWWNLQCYPNLLPSFTEIVRQSNPVDCEAVQGFQLHKMGLVHLHGTKASLVCELFRPFFCDRL
ncbi:AAA-like domain-containing protein [Halotia branconii]|uniref:AAA-like domain-containing protein n=1 Tax=Halotia branconii CENA392 TaxID=1539056 RepID=A0AAJ6NTN4_9CYAN|nr:AAA-like domain-containing protein [Halotia branconii]WGV26316.1 AAA-like domain-containing protein [Halotia branconii CENA392]